MIRLEQYFMLFLIYAILGWLLEVICKLIQYKKFINRGFLIGPYCPIYGFGALSITILLGKYAKDPFALFVLAVLISGTLEYMTSYVMEKIFHARWWDYSTKKFNINGRVTLTTLIPFGMFGVLCICYINPYIYSVLDRISSNTLNIMSISLFALIIIDAITSSIILADVRSENKVLDKDNTEVMSRIVREKIKDRGYLQRRLIEAFPTVRHIGIVLEKEKKSILKRIRRKKNVYTQKEEKIISKMNERLKLLNNEYEIRKKSIELKTEEKINKLRKEK